MHPQRKIIWWFISFENDHEPQRGGANQNSEKQIRFVEEPYPVSEVWKNRQDNDHEQLPRLDSEPNTSAPPQIP